MGDFEGRTLWSEMQLFLERPEHEGERRAEFMADVAEEGGFRPIQFSQGLGPALLGLISPGIVDGDGDMRVHHPEEMVIMLVKRPTGTDACDQDDTAVLGRRANRQQEALPRRFRPCAARQQAEPVRKLVQKQRASITNGGGKRPTSRRRIAGQVQLFLPGQASALQPYAAG